MSGHKYLADTNAYIFLLDKHPALKPLLNGEWYFSFITEIELKVPLITFDKGFTVIKSLDLVLLEP